MSESPQPEPYTPSPQYPNSECFLNPNVTTLTLSLASKYFFLKTGDTAAYVNSGLYQLGGSTILMSALTSVTAGTGSASKALILDSSSNIIGINNITLNGNLTASTSIVTPIINANSYLLAGASINLTAISGVTAGTAAASKAVILDASKNITSMGSISATTYTSTNNGSNYALVNGANSALIELSASPSLLRLVKGYTLSLNTGGCVIESGSSSRDPRHPLDMGQTARNDTICLYDDTSSFYGISANNSSTQYSSGTNHTWYTACSNASAINTNVMSLNSSGSLLTLANIIAGNSVIAKGFNISGVTGNNALMIVTAGLGWTFAYDYTGGNALPYKVGINNNIYCNSSNGFVTVNGSSAAAAPLEVRGFANFTKSGSFGYLSNSGAGTATGFTSRPFSILTDSAILCLSGEIDVFSDEMKKKDIKELDEEKANSFINNIKPITYKYKKGDDQQKMGFSAQQLVKYNFNEIVGYTHDEDDDLIEEIIESESGELYKKEKHTAFVVNLMGIIPILTKCVQLSNKKIKDNEEEIIRLNNRLNSFKQCDCKNNVLIEDLNKTLERELSDLQIQLNTIINFINTEIIKDPEEIEKNKSKVKDTKEVLATAPIAIEYLENIQK